MTAYEKWEDEREPLGMDLPLRDIKDGVSAIIEVVETKIPEAFEAGINSRKDVEQILVNHLVKIEKERDIAVESLQWIYDNGAHATKMELWAEVERYFKSNPA